MLDRLLEQRRVLQAVLSDRNITPKLISQDFEISEVEWTLIEGIINVLKPFELSTTFISTETYPSLSLAQPLLNSLLNNFLNSSQNDLPEITSLKYLIKSDLKSRYGSSGIQYRVGFRYDEVNIFDIASFLNIRYKNYERRLGILKEIKTKIQNEIDELMDISSQGEEELDSKSFPADFLFPVDETNSVSELDNYCLEIQLKKIPIY